MQASKNDDMIEAVEWLQRAIRASEKAIEDPANQDHRAELTDALAKKRALLGKLMELHQILN